MKGLEEVYKQIIAQKEYKFLGFFKYEGLRFLEELLDTDLGVKGRKETGKEPRKARPFIGRRRGDFLEVCFLTEKRKKYKIDLDLCKREDPSCSWIGKDSYAFYDRKRGYGRYLFKNLDELDYVLCGRCENLEFIDRLKVFEI